LQVFSPILWIIIYTFFMVSFEAQVFNFDKVQFISFFYDISDVYFLLVVT